MTNTTKKRKHCNKQNKGNQRETRYNDEQNNRASKPKRVNLQRIDITTPVSNTVHDYSSSSLCIFVDIKEIVCNGKEDSFEVMVNSGSEIVNLARQTKLYKSSRQEEICTDTLICIQ